MVYILNLPVILTECFFSFFYQYILLLRFLSLGFFLLNLNFRFLYLNCLFRILLNEIRHVHFKYSVFYYHAKNVFKFTPRLDSFWIKAFNQYGFVFYVDNFARIHHKRCVHKEPAPNLSANIYQLANKFLFEAERVLDF